MSVGAGQRPQVLEPTGQLGDPALDVRLDLGQMSFRHNVSTGWPASRTPFLNCVAASIACALALERDTLVREPIARLEPPLRQSQSPMLRAASRFPAASATSP